MNIPNFLTLFRIFLIPVFVLVFYLPFSTAHLVAAIIFAFAAVTDWLDGYLARSLSSTTNLGAFLDPVADKLMVSIALVMIVGELPLQFLPTFVLSIPAAIIVGREVLVSALREWMAEIGKRTSVKVSYLGKIKTSVQMFALIVLLACTETTPFFIVILGYILIYIAALLTLWSMILYLKAAWSDLVKNS